MDHFDRTLFARFASGTKEGHNFLSMIRPCPYNYTNELFQVTVETTKYYIPVGSHGKLHRSESKEIFSWADLY